MKLIEECQGKIKKLEQEVEALQNQASTAVEVEPKKLSELIGCPSLSIF